jgi:hypothetical protein
MAIAFTSTKLAIYGLFITHHYVGYSALEIALLQPGNAGRCSRYDKTQRCELKKMSFLK